MTDWIAIVPLKTAGDRKTRLADRLSAQERTALSKRMFAHVVGVLEGNPRIEVVVLSDQRPDGWDGAWIADEGRGLNAELEAARASLTQAALLVLHADLPLLERADVDALIAAAEGQRVAIAPDRHGSGTNGLALMPGARIAFRFGPDSFRLHRTQVPASAVVERPGFGLDLDTPDDLAAAENTGFSL
jgi:2-phospho-L-lactate guanylyltransferase